jgi:DNA-binding winged helix-turn-helix (wHTH) protein
MQMKQIKFLSIPIFITLFITLNGFSQNTQNEKHIEVSLRMIGHQVLLDMHDSVSRVLPIVEDSGRYKIQFETEFLFDSDKLVSTIIRVVKETKLANSYIVEVADCETNEVVYAFEIGKETQSDIIPCRGRGQAKSCYNLLFTLMEDNEVEDMVVVENIKEEKSGLFSALGPIIGGLLALIVLIVIIKNRKTVKVNPNLIAIGAFQFDKKNIVLLFEDQRIDLTSKEADLLLILFKELNNTIERDVILNMVWGDEGDYVGRTLDVFISKLRKKLELDPNLKIVNVRGVGYKLVLDI